MPASSDLARCLRKGTDTEAHVLGGESQSKCNTLARDLPAWSAKQTLFERVARVLLLAVSWQLLAWPPDGMVNIDTMIAEKDS